MAAALLAGGCAGPAPESPPAPPHIVWDAPPAEPVEIRPSESAQFKGKVPLPRKKPPETAPIDTNPEQLIGRTPPETANLLGRPTAQEDRATARIWAYNAPGCIFRVYFYPELDTLIYRALRFETETLIETKPGEPPCFVNLLKAARSNA